MEKEATKIFGIVLDNARSLYNEIQQQFYQQLDLDSKKLSIHPNEDIKIKEQIKASIGSFSYNVQELDFIINVQNIIKEEMKKAQTTGNYDLMQNSLIERLKGTSNIVFSLEDDFKTLSSKIANPFISQEDFYKYFMSKEEKIKNMIQTYNQNIINALINLTPTLVSELKENKEKTNETNKETTTIPNHNVSSSSVDSTIAVENEEKKDEKISSEVKRGPIESTDNFGNIKVEQEQLILACKNKYNEMQRRLSYLESGHYGSGSKINIERAQLKHAITKLEEFIKSLYIGKNTQELISRYSSEHDFDKRIESIIREALPIVAQVDRLTNEVNHIYGKRAKINYNQYELPKIDFETLHNRILTSTSLKDLLAGKKVIEQWRGTYDYDTNQRLEEEYNLLIEKIIALTMENEKRKSPNPEPTPNLNAAVGGSKSDIEYLIRKNKFYGVLQAIKGADVEKYNEFIMLGFNTMMNQWQQQASLCNSFIEREKSYQDFVELYENFKDYLPIEVGNMLKEKLEEMTKYIEQYREQNTEIIGTRYNTSRENSQAQAVSARKM